MPMSKMEKRWLDFAWKVVNPPQSHLDACIAAGAAVPGPDRVDGNDLRLPGYLGRNYRTGGVLCVGAVSREPSREDEAKDRDIARTNANLFETTRKWIKEGRSPESDADYLNSIRPTYEQALPSWSIWGRSFRPLVEDYLRKGIADIAYTNLAKCRLPIDRATEPLMRLCERGFIPIRDVVDLVQPTAVLVCVLGAGRSGDIVVSWDSERYSPLVYPFQGRNSTDPAGRRRSEWAPEMARKVRRQKRRRRM